MDFSEFTEVSKEPTEEPCKGVFFRGYSSLFYDGNKIEQRQGVRLLKGKSCTGCSQCLWVYDNLSEEVSCETLIMPKIEHGELYSVRIINESTDWETGIVDSWETEIYKVKPKGE